MPQTELNLFPSSQSTGKPTLSALYAQVSVSVTAKTVQEHVFTYRIPEEYAESVQVGQPVLVSFGSQRDLTGFVVELSEEYTGTHTLKEITEILDETPLFDADYFQFIRWVGEYYATPVSQVLACALPGALVQKSRKLVSLGPCITDPMALRKIPDTDLRQAMPLLNLLKERSDLSEGTGARKKSRGYTPKYLADRLRLPLKTLNKLLARLKISGLIRLETEFEAKTAPKTIRHVRLNPAALDSAEAETLTGRQREITDYLSTQPEGVPVRQLLESLSTTMPTLKKLETAGVVHMLDVEVHRDPLALHRKLLQEKPFTLSGSQQAAVDRVMQGDSTAPYLLYGVTGSGKTEVYMSLTRRALEQNQSVLVMVPEIALTSQIARRFIAHFGAENIALWHSNLSDGEKADTWKKLQSGELRILIGARSAIWAPLRNLGMILIDEEHESSYKQDSPAPRYNAKTLAFERARRTGARLVMGSATPEVSSFYAARRDDRILNLPERFGGRGMADVLIADMRQERAQGNQGQLSRLLETELKTNLENGEQSIILLNRRGFYTTIQCVICDYVFMCPNCDVAVTYHRQRNQVRCHYCGHEASRPVYCPVCAGMELSHTGVGTQRIEDEVARKLPDARVLRLDSDVMQRKNAHLEIFDAFSSGEADILIGTQIVAKGLDVANVTLAGVISADSSFSLPDYKSAERGFQLLTQLAGRSGRGDKPGRVVIQAVQTSHPVLGYARKQDYEGFYQEEIAQREVLDFPPYSQLFRFIVSGENEVKTQQFIQTASLHLGHEIRQAGLSEVIRFLGPAPCVLPRIQNRYRFHLLLKSRAGVAGHALIAKFYREASRTTLPDDLNFILDIDAQSLL